MAEMPLVVKGPWTRDARERAAAVEIHEAFIRYFRKAMKVRNWLPWDDLPLREMHEIDDASLQRMQRLRAILLHPGLRHMRFGGDGDVEVAERKGIGPGVVGTGGQRHLRGELAKPLLPEDVLRAQVTASVDPVPSRRRLRTPRPVMTPRAGGIVVHEENARGIRRRSELESLEGMEVILHNARVKLVGAESLDHGDKIALRIAEREEPHGQIFQGLFVLPPDHSGHHLVKGLADHGSPFIRPARFGRDWQTMRDMIGRGYEGFAAKCQSLPLETVRMR